YFSSRIRHTILDCDWSPDVCSSDLAPRMTTATVVEAKRGSVPPRLRASLQRRRQRRLAHGLRFAKARQHFSRKQLGRGLADVPRSEERRVRTGHHYRQTTYVDLGQR